MQENKTFWQVILELNMQHGKPWVFERHIVWAKTKSADKSPGVLWRLAKEALQRR